MTAQSSASCALATGPSPPRPRPAHVPRPRLCQRRRQALRGEGDASSHSPTRLGCKRQTSESALTTRNPSGPERGTQASPSQERPLCLKIQPAYKHTLSTRLHSRGRGKNNPSLQPRRNVHTDILSGRPPGVGGRGSLIWCENLKFDCTVSKASPISHIIPEKCAFPKNASQAT